MIIKEMHKQMQQQKNCYAGYKCSDFNFQSSTFFFAFETLHYSKNYLVQ